MLPSENNSLGSRWEKEKLNEPYHRHVFFYFLRSLGIREPQGTHSQKSLRLQAVPFWSVEMVRSQHSETGARRNKREETGDFLFLSPFSRLSPSPPLLVCSSFFALGYFAQPLDYPERDCLQSKKASLK